VTLALCTAQHCTVQYSTVQYNTVQYSTLQQFSGVKEESTVVYSRCCGVRC